MKNKTKKIVPFYETGKREVKMNDVDLKQTAAVGCPKCANATFEKVLLLRFVPAVIAPEGKAAIVSASAVRCTSCKTMIDLEEELIKMLRAPLAPILQ